MKWLPSMILLFMSTHLKAQEMRVATYNLRFDNPRDSGNLWKNRAPILISLLRFHDFDLFGTQEGLANQLHDISAALPSYERVGAGRDDGREKGEHSAIFYKKSRFNLLQQGNFWLSETPDKPSLGWDAKCCFRICSWVYLLDRQSGKKFYFFNAHYDHEGVRARVESSKLVVRKIRSIAGTKPVIFSGDLNGGHESEWYLELANSALLRDSYQLAKFPYANNGSFNGFKGTAGSMAIIDHIFLSPAFTLSKWGILTDTYHGKYPSDHFPVMAEIRF